MEDNSELPKPKEPSRRSFLQKLGTAALALLSSNRPAELKPAEAKQSQTPIIPGPKLEAIKFEIQANPPRIDPKSPDALIIQKENQ